MSAIVRICLLEMVPIPARADWRDIDVGNDQLCIPYISLYGSSRWGSDSASGDDGCLEKVIDS